MKITKSQLQQIIQEELNGVLSEYSAQDALTSPLGQAATWTWGKLTGQDPEDVESQVERGLQAISRGKPFGGRKAARRDIVGVRFGDRIQSWHRPPEGALRSPIGMSQGARVGPEGESHLVWSDRPKIYDPERWAAGIPNWLERLKGKPSGEEEEEAPPELKGPQKKSRRYKNIEFREKFKEKTGRPPKRMDYPQHGKKA